MAAAKKKPAPKIDPVLEAAVEYFAGRSHDAWRQSFLKANPDQRGRPRMRLRGGVMVDINQPWRKLDPKAQADNKHAASDAYDAVVKFPKDREAASDYVHKSWIKRNKADKSLAKELFMPYRQLSEVEKDKDRAHVDRMKDAIAAVRKSAKQKPPRKAKAKAVVLFKTVRVDAKRWARLEAAAKKLSALTGRTVAPEALLSAGIEAILAVSGGGATKAKAKKT